MIYILLFKRDKIHAINNIVTFTPRSFTARIRGIRANKSHGL